MYSIKSFENPPFWVQNGDWLVFLNVLIKQIEGLILTILFVYKKRMGLYIKKTLQKNF